MLHVARPQTFQVRYRNRLGGRESELTAKGLSWEEERGRMRELYAEDHAGALTASKTLHQLANRKAGALADQTL